MASADPNLDLLVHGVSAVAEVITATESGSREEASESWLRFEAQLEAADEEVPLASLVNRLRLNRFQIRSLLLALSTHIEPRMSEVINDRGRTFFTRGLTVRLAIECFCRTSEEKLRARQEFLPPSGLIKHRLIVFGEQEAGATGLLARRFELSTPTLRFLLQEQQLVDTLASIARLEYPNVSLFNVILPADQMEQVRELVDQHGRYRETIHEWGFDQVLPYGRGLTLLFSGPSGTGKTLLAQAIAAHCRRPLVTLSACDLPEKEGVDTALREITSEATMRDAIVLIDECEALFAKHDKRKATAFKAIEDFEGILVLTTNHPETLDDALERRIIFHLPFELPEPQLRRQIWEVHLPPEVPLTSDIDLDILANRYDFTGGTIKNAILVAVNRALSRTPEDPALTMELLDEGCRSQLRYALEELTLRTTTQLRLKDIVLPDEPLAKVKEILAAIRNQAVVLNRWGFGKKLVTGKGITILFDGPPGTGKTFASEIIAGECDRPLYRVNLPEVVSKWVGETEKHIRAIFQQARVSHAMLLFDEADALFTSRSAETRNATDRYANMEVNLLLQEIERFPGVCILTTNFFGSLDKALIRRIQFRVTFEEPDEEQRSKIWEVLCPPEAPIAKDVDFDALGVKFELTGGMIKNALLRAAYIACEAGTDITNEVLNEACLAEYKAAGKVTRDPSYVPPPTEIIGRPVPVDGSEGPLGPLPDELAAVIDGAREKMAARAAAQKERE